MAQGAFRPTSVQTVRTLLLVGLLFQVFQVVFYFGVAYYLSRAVFFGSIVFYFGAIGIVWLVLVYLFSYRPASAGEIEQAKTPTLIFGLLSIFSVSIISGLLYVLAYHTMGTAREPPPPPRPLAAPRPLLGGTKTCAVCGRANPAGNAFCQGCGFGLH